MIYVFLADGFEEMEALITVDLLRRAELEVKTVGIGGRQITGAHGIPVLADLADTEAVTDGLQMVVLPGGLPGTPNLEQSPVVQRFIDYAVDQGLYLAAICAAPSILGHKGLLKGKQATCYPGYEEELTGAQVTGEPVVVDGQFITAKGAGVTIPFALELISLLKNRELADTIKAAIQCI